MDKKRLILELFNIAGQLNAAGSAAWVAALGPSLATVSEAEGETGYAAMAAAGFAAENAALDAASDAALDFAGYAKRFAAREATWNVASAVVTEVKNLMPPKGTDPQVIAKASCRAIIAERKKFHREILRRVDEKLPSKIGVFDVCELISRLLTFEETKLESLKLTIPLQLCNYLFLTEKVIRVSRQVQLLEQHARLVKATEMEEEYRSLFRRFDVVVTNLEHLLPCFPRVLIDVIADYYRFHWSLDGSEDEDELYQQLLSR